MDSMAAEELNNAPEKESGEGTFLRKNLPRHNVFN